MVKLTSLFILVAFTIAGLSLTPHGVGSLLSSVEVRYLP